MTGSLSPAAALRLLLVEDEPLVARSLALRVEALGYVPVGPLATAAAAREAFRLAVPPVDLALLDINLLDGDDGISLGQELLAIRPVPLIFLTSQADVETFERAKALRPAAYLLKPFDEGALQRAVELALLNFSAEQPAAAGGADLGMFWNHDLVIRESLFLRDRGRLTKVNIEDIAYVEADDKYCTVVTRQGKFAARLPLRELALELPPTRFVQTHRSFVVNADCIEHIDSTANTLSVMGSKLPLGRSYREVLFRRLRLVG